MKLNKKTKKVLLTNHGEIQPPFFMPDATRGFVKFLSKEDLEKASVKAVVINTYHLLLRPGELNFKESKGVHRWLNWNIPILSDSGGYQIFSLIHKNPQMGKISDKGAHFRSPLDGSWYQLTPEKSIQIQFDLGVDMMVVLDDPPPNYYTEEKVKQAVDRTLRWALRSIREYKKQIKRRKINRQHRPLIFCVIQGGAHNDLRAYCAQELNKMAKKEKDDYFSGWDGYGFGGRHVNEEGELLEDTLKITSETIPDSAWKFALGIGKPEDIRKSVSWGWEIFDCVIPTREGRHGKLFLRKHREIIHNGKLEYETINILNERYKNNFSLISNFCNCELCQQYNFSFLHHLFKYRDPLGMRLAALHNLKFYMDLMDELRDDKNN